MQTVRNVDDDFKTMTRDTWVKVSVIMWFLVVIAGVIMVSIAVAVGSNNNKRLATITNNLDDAEAFDFDAFASTACRTAEGTQLLIKDGTPIVVQPYLDAAEKLRHFPEGIKTPCYESSTGGFDVRSQAGVITQNPVEVSKSTLLENPQGLGVNRIEIDCALTAPCLLPAGYCATAFDPTTPYGPIYRLTRTRVGAGNVTLEHTCVCILDWDPVAETNRTVPYCTEPLKAQ